MIVEFENVWKSYSIGKTKTNANTVDALKGINISLAEGDFISFAGPSGSGKTTMMNIIGLIDKPTSGSVHIDGMETANLSRRALTKMRQQTIGFVFQSFNLLPVLNVFENVEFPLVIGQRGGTKAERADWVNHLLEQVGLADRSKHLPSELSGGQQQRVAIARALVNHPKIVIADEPTANLDSANGKRVLELMKKVNQEDKTTFIFSTHDSSIWEIATHVIFLRDGNIESEKRQ